jgi:hypothetical protein
MWLYVKNFFLLRSPITQLVYMNESTAPSSKPAVTSTAQDPVSREPLYFVTCSRSSTCAQVKNISKSYVRTPEQIHGLFHKHSKANSRQNSHSIDRTNLHSAPKQFPWEDRCAEGKDCANKKSVSYVSTHNYKTKEEPPRRWQDSNLRPRRELISSQSQ